MGKTEPVSLELCFVERRREAGASLGLEAASELSATLHAALRLAEVPAEERL